MSQVYLVTSGSYSDYHVVGVFSTKENAEAHVRAFSFHAGRSYGDDYMRIEEHELDPMHEDVQAGMIPYFLRIEKNGDVTDCHIQTGSFGFPDTECHPDVRGSLYTHVLAKDEEHATKITNERRVRWLAENGGP